MYPGELEDYLNEIADRLGQLGGTFVEGPIVDVDWERRVGAFRSRQRFTDGSSLAIRLICSGPERYPEWIDYSIYFMDSEDRCVFRYDNAEYHLGSMYFPHHKHVGPEETPVDHPRPSLAQIIDEVRAHLYPEKPPAQ